MRQQDSEVAGATTRTKHLNRGWSADGLHPGGLRESKPKEIADQARKGGQGRVRRKRRERSAERDDEPRAGPHTKIKKVFRSGKDHANVRTVKQTAKLRRYRRKQRARGGRGGEWGTE